MEVGTRRIGEKGEGRAVPFKPLLDALQSSVELRRVDGVHVLGSWAGGGEGARPDGAHPEADGGGGRVHEDEWQGHGCREGDRGGGGEGEDNRPKEFSVDVAR